MDNVQPISAAMSRTLEQNRRRAWQERRTASLGSAMDPTGQAMKGVYQRKARAAVLKIQHAPQGIFAV